MPSITDHIRFYNPSDKLSPRERLGFIKKDVFLQDSNPSQDSLLEHANFLHTAPPTIINKNQMAHWLYKNYHVTLGYVHLVVVSDTFVQMHDFTSKHLRLVHPSFEWQATKTAEQNDQPFVQFYSSLHLLATQGVDDGKAFFTIVDELATAMRSTFGFGLPTGSQVDAGIGFAYFYTIARMLLVRRSAFLPDYDVTKIHPPTFVTFVQNEQQKLTRLLAYLAYLQS